MQAIVIDRGASEHVATTPEYLLNLTEIPPVAVELANETTVTATKLGIAEIDVREKDTLECKAYWIPEIKLNLLFCSKMEEYGLTTTFELGKCKTFGQR